MTRDQNLPDTIQTKKKRLPKTTLRHPLYTTKCQHSQNDPDVGACFSCTPVRPVLIPDSAFENQKDRETAEFDSLLLGYYFSNQGIITRKNFTDAQSKDHFCMKIKEDLSNQKSFKLCNDLLTFRNKPVLPKSLLYYVLHSMHFSSYSHHMSAHAMHSEISSKYYVPDLKAILKEFLDHCYFCMTERTSRRRHQTIGRNERATHSREIWSLDLFSGMGTGSQGERFVAIFVCDFSLFTIAVPLKDKSTESIIKAFRNHIITPFGPPRVLRTDGETAILRSNKFNELLHAFRIKHLATAPSSPWTNGLAERMVAKYKQQIRTYSKSHNRPEFSEYLAILSNSINTTPTTYGVTPQDLMFGHTNTTFRDLLPTQKRVKTHDQYLHQLKTNIETAEQTLTTRRNASNKATTDNRNRQRQQRTFNEGQLVYIRNNAITTNSGLVSRKKGPYVIIAINKSNHTAQLQHLHTKNTCKAHYDHIFAIPSLTQYTMLEPNGIDLIQTT